MGLFVAIAPWVCVALVTCGVWFCLSVLLCGDVFLGTDLVLCGFGCFSSVV